MVIVAAYLCDLPITRRSCLRDVARRLGLIGFRAADRPCEADQKSYALYSAPTSRASAWGLPLAKTDGNGSRDCLAITS